DAAGFQASTLPPYVRIDRELQLGRKWQGTTRVVRKTAPGNAGGREVPLLPRGAVTTGEGGGQDGQALVNMGPTMTEVSWQSLLSEQPRLMLTAPKGVPWSETWRLTVSPMYHVELSGISVIHQQDPSGIRHPEWRPWPGEQAVIDITR